MVVTKVITHNSQVYKYEHGKWYVKVFDIRHNGQTYLWQPLSILRVPTEVQQQL